jgi:uncharacterized protein YukE
LKRIIDHDIMVVNSSRAQLLQTQFYEEGIMARIRVNTEDLKNKAKDFDSAAEAFNRAGDDILAAAMAMPSYDGQLSGPARKAGYEIQSQARELKAALSNNADSLRKAAQAFEEVDNRTVESLSQNQEMLLAAGSPGGPPYPYDFQTYNSEGTSCLGYNVDPVNAQTVIICKDGVCKKVLNDEAHKDAVDRYKAAVLAYKAAKEDMDYHARNIENDAVALAGVVGSGMVAGTMFAAPTFGLAALGAAITMTAAMIKIVEDQNWNQEQYWLAYEELEKAADRAAVAWNELVPGENQTGDSATTTDSLGLLLPCPGEDKPVYDPPNNISSETPEPG